MKKETLTQVFSSKFCKIFKKTCLTEHLRTAASETVTENSLENSVRDENFSASDEKPHIISIFSTRLTELKFSAWVENLHIINPLDVWLYSKYTSALRLRILVIEVLANVKWLGCRVSQRESANFCKYQNHILTLTICLEDPLH